jgi:DNA-binding CsgD family transcriptional regulator
MYIGQKVPKFPLTDYTPPKHDRNHQIRAEYARGKTERELAEIFGISHQRVSQILHGRRK